MTCCNHVINIFDKLKKILGGTSDGEMLLSKLEIVQRFVWMVL